MAIRDLKALALQMRVGDNVRERRVRFGELREQLGASTVCALLTLMDSSGACLCKSSACATDVRLIGMKFRPFCLRNGCRRNEGTLRPPGTLLWRRFLHCG